MDFIKKQKVGFYLSVATALLAIIAFIIYFANSNTQYFNDVNSSIVSMTILSVLFSCATAALVQFDFSKNVYVKVALDVLRIAAAVLLIWSVTIFIGLRVEKLAYVFGSELEADNADAQSAVSQAIVGFVFYFLAWIVSVVSMFFSLTPKKN